MHPVKPPAPIVRRAGVGPQGLLPALLLSALLAATAAATCYIQPPYTAPEGYGQANPAAPNMVQSCTGDPINCATGNLTEEQTDIAPLGGRGPDFGVTRTYNAQLAAEQETAGPYGFGWTGPYSDRLVINSEAKTATVHHDNGSTTV